MGTGSAHVVIVSATLITMAAHASVVITPVIYMTEWFVVDQVVDSVVVEGVYVDLAMSEKLATAPLKLRHVSYQGIIVYAQIKGLVCVEDVAVEMDLKVCTVRIQPMQLEYVKS